MSNVSNLVALLVLGFAFLMPSHLCRYWLIRQSGYLLFFAVILAGCIAAILVNTLAIFALGMYDLVPKLKPTHFDVFQNVDHVSLLTGTFLAFLIGSCTNIFFNRSKSAKLVSQQSGDLIEYLLQEALDNTTLVELSMANGKFYVGYPVDSGITTFHESDISIIPTMSGYRDETTKEFRSTTFYRSLLEKARSRSRIVIFCRFYQRIR